MFFKKKKPERTTIEKINYVFVNCEDFSEWAMVYQCMTCKSRFIDINENFQFCPCCGRKIANMKE